MLLKDVYGPLDTFLKNGSLHTYVFQNRGILKNDLHNFREDISLLIDKALNTCVCSPNMGWSSSDSLKCQEQLKTIESTLAPLLKAEIKRLKKIIKNEAG